MMFLNDYQARAAKFRLPSATPEYVNLMLPGEVGEYCSLKAKCIRDGYGLDHELNAKKELGDVLWGIAMAAMDNGWTLEEVAWSNINKLQDRQDRNVITGSGDNR